MSYNCFEKQKLLQKKDTKSMGKNLLYTFQKVVLSLLIITLPFNMIPRRFAVPGIHQDLSVLFLCIGILLIVYEYIRFGFHHQKKIKIFFIVFFLWQILSLVHGLCIYNFNNLLIVDRLPFADHISDSLVSYGIADNKYIGIKVWLFFKSIKNILLVDDTVFLVLFYVYHLYKDDFDSGFRDIRRAILILTIMMGAYSFVELLWLKLNLPVAAEMLGKINTFFYDPHTAHGWYPPLLWRNQLRSFCPEPSFVGVLGAFSLPFLWSCLFSKSTKVKYLSALFIFYFSIMVFATNARTAIVLVILEVLLLAVFSFTSSDKKIFIKKSVVIIMLTSVAFGFNLLQFNDSDLEGNYVLSAQDYLEQNVVSAYKKNARSNGARLYVIQAGLSTIKESPVLGIGYDLADGYVDKEMPAEAFDNTEVLRWHEDLYATGILESGMYPQTNKFVDSAVYYGIIGLGFYLLPIGYLLFNLAYYRRKLFKDFRTIALSISLIGLLAAQCSSINFMACDGIVWGLLYCKIDQIIKLRQ